MWKVWHRRENEFHLRTPWIQERVARIVCTVHPLKRNRSFSSVLLHQVAGAKSFKDMRTVAETVCTALRETGTRLGLLSEGTEWNVLLIHLLHRLCHWSIGCRNFSTALSCKPVTYIFSWPKHVCTRYLMPLSPPRSVRWWTACSIVFSNQNQRIIDNNELHGYMSSHTSWWLTKLASNTHVTDGTVV